MATWPESDPKPRYPLEIEAEYNTLTSSFDNGKEQRRQKLLFPRYNVVINYPLITKTEANTLWNFYIARAGAYESFYVYDLAIILGHVFNHLDQYCGTGDGSTTIFDIPGRSTSSQTVYKDKVDYTSYTTILIGGGSAASDRVQFTSNTPAAGEIVSVDFYGYLRMKVRFAEDKLTRTNFNRNLYNFGIALKGVTA